MTGEELYGVHRRSLCHVGVTTKAAFQEMAPPPHWYQLDEKVRQAWEATAVETTRQHLTQLTAVTRLLHRDPDVHGTPRITDGMLRGREGDGPQMTEDFSLAVGR